MFVDQRWFEPQLSNHPKMQIKDFASNLQDSPKKQTVVNFSVSCEEKFQLFSNEFISSEQEPTNKNSSDEVHLVTKSYAACDSFSEQYEPEVNVDLQSMSQNGAFQEILQQESEKLQILVQQVKEFNNSIPIASDSFNLNYESFQPIDQDNDKNFDSCQSNMDSSEKLENDTVSFTQNRQTIVSEQKEKLFVDPLVSNNSQIAASDSQNQLNLLKELQQCQRTEEMPSDENHILLDTQFILHAFKNVALQYPFTQLTTFLLTKLSQQEVVIICKGFLEFIHSFQHTLFNLDDKMLKLKFGLNRSQANVVVENSVDMFLLFVQQGEYFLNNVQYGLKAIEWNNCVSQKMFLNVKQLGKLYAFLIQIQEQELFIVKVVCTLFNKNFGAKILFFANFYCCTLETNHKMGILTLVQIINLIQIVFQAHKDLQRQYLIQLVEGTGQQVSQPITFTIKYALEQFLILMENQFDPSIWQQFVQNNDIRQLNSAQLLNQIPCVPKGILQKVGYNLQLNVDSYDYIDFKVGVKLLLPPLLQSIDSSFIVQLSKQLQVEATRNGFSYVKHCVSENKKGEVLVIDLYKQLISFLQAQACYFDASDV